MGMYSHLYDCVHVCVCVVYDWRMPQDSHPAYIPNKDIPASSVFSSEWDKIAYNAIYMWNTK